MLSNNNKYILVLFLAIFLSLLTSNINFNLNASKKSINSISISNMLEKYEHGDLDYCRRNIDILANKYKNNSNILYIKGLIEKDGKKSIEYFKKIVKKFKTSSKNSIAKKKVKDFQNLQKYLSELNNNDMNIISENRNTNINKYRNQQSLKKKNKRIKIRKNKFETKELIKYRFTVQLGVFSSLKNAISQKKRYSFLDTFVKTENKDGVTLNRVMSGKYKTKKEAIKRADFLMKRYELKTIIKELDE